MTTLEMFNKYQTPQRYPPDVMTDRRSGRTVKMLDIGCDTVRPYVTSQHWTHDGKSFIVADNDNGILYQYNVEDETLRSLDILDKGIAWDSGFAVITPNNIMFYIKSLSQIWKMDLNTYEKQLVSELDPCHRINVLQATDDGKYLTCYWVEQDSEEDFRGTENVYRVIPRLNTETGEWDNKTIVKRFENEQFPHAGHPQLNPKYDNLVMFCHEGTTTYIPDRIWIGNYDTGEKRQLFIQAGVRGNDAITGETTGHEVWGINGEYAYFVKYPKSIYVDNVGKCGLVRIDKDGNNREYINHDFDYWHCYPSDDDNWVASDTIEHGPHAKVVLVDIRTYRSYVIADYSCPRGGNHPFQPHPVIAPGRKYLSYVMTNPNKDHRLVCAWQDISDITMNQYSYEIVKMNDDISFISANDGEWCSCQVNTEEVDGKKCYIIPRHSAMYANVNDSITTDVNTSIKLKITYMDKQYGGVMIYYTSAQKDMYDVANHEDMCHIIRYTGTNTWKTAEVELNGINMANRCSHHSDLKIQGLDADAIVSGIEVIK